MKFAASCRPGYKNTFRSKFVFCRMQPCKSAPRKSVCGGQDPPPVRVTPVQPRAVSRLTHSSNRSFADPLRFPLRLSLCLPGRCLARRPCRLRLAAPSSVDETGEQTGERQAGQDCQEAAARGRGDEFKRETIKRRSIHAAALLSVTTDFQNWLIVAMHEA